jgi:cytochrome c oxidase subunit 2
MEPAEYEAWLSRGGDYIASAGERLFRHFQCIGCHRADSGARGPNLAGLFGKTVHLADGKTLLADETYIRESILLPKSKLVAGFQPIMPVYQGQINEEELLRLVTYVKWLQLNPLNVNPKAPVPPPEEFKPVPKFGAEGKRP